MAVADGCLIRQPRVGRRSEVLCAGAGPGPWCPMFSFFLPVLCLSPELAQAPYPVDISGAGWGGALDVPHPTPWPQRRVAWSSAKVTQEWGCIGLHFDTFERPDGQWLQ